MGLRRDEFVDALVENFATTIAPLGHDEQLRQLLSASTEANVVAILHVLEHGIDPRVVEPPPAAAQYARRLAQQSIPLSALLRAYRLGHADFVEVRLNEISTDPGRSGISRAIGKRGGAFSVTRRPADGSPFQRRCSPKS